LRDTPRVSGEPQRNGGAVRAAALRVKTAAHERREEERRSRRSAILAAAKRIYSRRGFHAATIEEIAAAARVSVGTIYLYFESKEDLYVSLLAGTMDAFAAGLTRLLHSRLRPDRKARAAWNFFYSFRQRFPESYRVLFLFHHGSFPRTVPAATLAALNRGAGRNFAIASQIIREAMEAGFYRRGNPREVLDIMWSTFMGLVHLSETRANLALRISTLEELHQRAFEIFEQGLRIASLSPARDKPRPRAAAANRE
jgi:AcrR family transcriptional regulator